MKNFNFFIFGFYFPALVIYSLTSLLLGCKEFPNDYCQKIESVVLRVSQNYHGGDHYDVVLELENNITLYLESKDKVMWEEGKTYLIKHQGKILVSFKEVVSEPSTPIPKDEAVAIVSTIIYTIYENPKDHPEEFVVRKWVAQGPLSEIRLLPEGIIGKAKTLDEVRKLIPEDWVCLGQFPGMEDPVIKESWTPKPNK